jgi:conjugal transfer pilus assembly protein TraV
VKLFSHRSPINAVFFLLLLTGCGPILNPYEEHFKCKTPAEDGKCIDTPAAYMEARHPEEKNGQKEGCINCEGTAAVHNPPTPREGVQDARYRILNDLLQEPDKPLLQPPKILRVLMLPYEGEHGELFMTRFVYVQVEDAKWLLTEQHEKGVR